jgi:hypothetical protein
MMCKSAAEPGSTRHTASDRRSGPQAADWKTEGPAPVREWAIQEGPLRSAAWAYSQGRYRASGEILDMSRLSAGKHSATLLSFLCLIGALVSTTWTSDAEATGPTHVEQIRLRVAPHGSAPYKAARQRETVPVPLQLSGGTRPGPHWALVEQIAGRMFQVDHGRIVPTRQGGIIGRLASASAMPGKEPLIEVKRCEGGGCNLTFRDSQDAPPVFTGALRTANNGTGLRLLGHHLDAKHQPNPGWTGE